MAAFPAGPRQSPAHTGCSLARSHSCSRSKPQKKPAVQASASVPEPRSEAWLWQSSGSSCPALALLQRSFCLSLFCTQRTNRNHADLAIAQASVGSRSGTASDEWPWLRRSKAAPNYGPTLNRPLKLPCLFFLETLGVPPAKKPFEALQTRRLPSSVGFEDSPSSAPAAASKAVTPPPPKQKSPPKRQQPYKRP